MDDETEVVGVRILTNSDISLRLLITLGNTGFVH